MTQVKYVRRKKFIDARIQLRFMLMFVAICSAGVIVETVVLQLLLRRAARELPNDGMLLVQAAPEIVLSAGILTFVMLVPIALALGVRTTFPIVGPLYRFRVFLSDVIAGRQSDPCRIRKGDELTDVCELLNEVTQEARRLNEGRGGTAGAEGRAEAPRAA